MRVKRTIIFSFFLISLTLFVSEIRICYPQTKKPPPSEQELYRLEMNLFELVNKEREKFGLSTLQFSSDLRLLARKHSQDMASRGYISHYSSSGKSYKDRIVDEGFYFISIGENVAFSSSILAKPIHQALMNSLGHRENILKQAFNQVGIGVVFQENDGYYVTQDFRRAPLSLGEEEAKEEVKKRLNALRSENSSPPLIFLKNADRFAQIYSEKKADDRTPPPVPSEFRSVQILFISSPALEGIGSIYRDKVLNAKYVTAGLGVCFGRTDKYPGGAYFITILLFPKGY